MGTLGAWPLVSGEVTVVECRSQILNLPVAGCGPLTAFSPAEEKRKWWAPLPGPGLKIPGMCSCIPCSSLKLYQSNKSPALTTQTVRVRLMVATTEKVPGALNDLADESHPFNWAIHIELLNKREINLNILSATVFYSLLHPFSFYLPSNICPSFSHSSFFKNSSFMESFWDNCGIFTPLPSHHRPLFSTILQLSSQFVSMTCLLFCLPERSNSEF